MKRGNSQIFKVAMYVMGIALAIFAIFLPTQVGIYAGQFLLLIAAAAALLFPIYFAFTHPKEAMYAGIGILILGVIFLISYFIADSDPVYGLVQGVETEIADESTSKLAGAGINTFIALLALTVIGLIATEITSIF